MDLFVVKPRIRIYESIVAAKFARNGYCKIIKAVESRGIHCLFDSVYYDTPTRTSCLLYFESCYNDP